MFNAINDFEYAIDEDVYGNLIKQIGPSSNTLIHPVDFLEQINAVLSSWRDSFYYKVEEVESQIDGLRTPQIGAVHAVHAHWAVSTETATVVMPTGTGKTETMLSILVTKRCSRLLVVVPTDALRTQIAKKFLTLGVLKKIGVVSDDALFPIVGMLRHIPKTVEEVDDFFTKCNVVVTTMKIVADSEPDVQDRISSHCPYLFIDEAHHVAAPTWKKFTDRFQENTILQFTATPFRNDGKPVVGKIIFNFSLKKAQEEGYFRPINFKPVIEFDQKREIWQ